MYNIMLNKLDRLKEKKIYFIHVPKTSGTALESKQIIKLGHGFNVPNVYRTPADKKGFSGYGTDKWHMYNYPVKDNYKITIIRNPFDLLCSYYHHGDKLNPFGRYCHSGWASVNYTHQFKTFKEFITAYCDPNFEWHQPAFKNFLFSQLFNENHDCVADIIIKYEFLNEAIDELNKYIRFPIKKQIKNKSSNKKHNYKHYYDDEMIEMVKNKCKAELEHFNYDFNGSTKHEPFVETNIRYNVHENIFVD